MQKKSFESNPIIEQRITYLFPNVYKCAFFKGQDY